METEELSMREAFMREAIGLAKEGVSRGDGGPFGAVVVRSGEVVGRGWNRVVVDNDPTAHAEMVAIRDACRRLGVFHLRGCELYTACEPCPMCLAAVHWARLEQVWYAASTVDAAAVGFDDAHIHRQVRLPEEHRLLPHDRLLAEEALEVFRLWRDSKLRVDY